MSKTDIPENSLIVCVDIGSIARKRFAWAKISEPVIGNTPDQLRNAKFGDAIDELAETVVGELNANHFVALGVECPAWVPVAAQAADLGKARPGEGRYSWSAGAGAGALATGLSQIAWILQHVREALVKHDAEKAPKLKVTTNRETWKATTPSSERPRILLWEAFVTGPYKPAVNSDVESQHHADAMAGLDAFVSGTFLPRDPVPATAVNLLALLAHWADFEVDADEFTQPLPIYAPGPQNQG